MEHRFTNKLIQETSPYLLQHAHNPVNWYPWSEEALQLAKDKDKIILVSIGYSACHWCHVMERESFENEAVAGIMNEHLINIKIDREERPDLDHIYMDAVQAMTGSGGWPLNVFLTPDGKPFYGGTYFPPQPAFNRQSWTDILLAVAEAWKSRKHEIISQAENLTAYLQQSGNFGQNKVIPDNPEADLFNKEQCHTIFRGIMKTADKEWGGFGKAPKFPQTFNIQFLLRYYHFFQNEEALQQALLSIDKMLQGGIYDHVGGGLARYSTDTEWLAPHFEKMLYDNALLVSTLSDAYKITKNPDYEKAIRKTIRFVEKELMNEDGGFYAALDADSEGEEGKYYIWSKEEVEELLGADAKLFCEFYDITEHGNWEEKNILRVLVPVNAFIQSRNIEKKQFEGFLENCLLKLEEHRSSRIKPSLDDKILLNWNGMMLTALCNAAAALEDDSYKLLAEKSFSFIVNNFLKKKDSYEMNHTFKNGVARYPAFLDDYAHFIAASISLYELTFNIKILETAKSCCNYVLENFSDTDSPYLFFTHKAQIDVIVRQKEIYDGATPSGNSIMAGNLFRLGLLFDKADWQQKAINMLKGVSETIIKYPGSFGIWTMFLQNQVIGLNEIVIIGTCYEKTGEEINAHFIPNSILMGSVDEDESYPLLRGKKAKGENQIFLCKNYSCEAPFSKTGTLIAAISLAIKL